MVRPIQVFSEIGRLKTVLLHRPGKELENLMPDYLERFLFDDIPFLAQAQKEHDNFAEKLRSKGVEVVYLEDLAAESIAISEEVKRRFIFQYLQEAQVKSTRIAEKIANYLLALENPRDLIDQTMAGFQRTEIEIGEAETLSEMGEDTYPFLIDPMPNLYFTRDNFATIGHAVSLNHMYSATRNRETIYAQYIFDYHPRFQSSTVPRLYERNETMHLEGGDELILSEKVVAVGISQRTSRESIEKLAKNIFAQKMGFEKVLAFDIGCSRKFMHLDTVFTMVDVDKFTIHPEIEGDLIVYTLTNQQGSLKVEKEQASLDEILRQHLGLKHVQLIRCGGGNVTAAAREQWNDGSNTLTIAPGEVIVYDRNPITNQLLEAAGITVHAIPGSELVRGRGGPRCMSMPLVREKVTKEKE